MMFEEQILEIAYKHLLCYDYHSERNEWIGDKQDILDFARAMYEEGYDDGVNSVDEGMV